MPLDPVKGTDGMSSVMLCLSTSVLVSAQAAGDRERERVARVRAYVGGEYTFLLNLQRDQAMEAGCDCVKSVANSLAASCRSASKEGLMKSLCM